MVGMLKHEEDLVRIRDGCYVATGQYQRLGERVNRHFQLHDEPTTLEFNEMVRLARKYVISPDRKPRCPQGDHAQGRCPDKTEMIPAAVRPPGLRLADGGATTPAFSLRGKRT